MAISDIIENYIKELLTNDNEVIIKRNDLANYFNCVPSQINYVIATRFTNEHGFIVESRRGGGGGITIRKVMLTKNDYISSLININSIIVLSFCLVFVPNCESKIQ